MRGPFQVLSDCPSCRVEASFVELVDPQDRLGVALEGECRLCRHRVELGLEVREGDRFGTAASALVALRRWADEEGEELRHFTTTNFGGQAPDTVAALLVRQERVETGFDVVAFLFPGAAGGSAAPPEPTVAPPDPLEAGPQDASAPVPARPWDPRDAARALATIVVADGEIRPAERRFVDGWLAAAGLPPLDPADLRVWRPHELGPPPDPPGMLAAMRRCALSDGEADGTEVRLLDEYARAWRVPLDPAGLRPPDALRAAWSAFAELFVR